ncbi:MAG: PAS domain S-box protein [Ignavibacteria bacterium]|jgi:PAS domain S-box-containing protein|nr:PAS domain S-box protein [Ignavibacteria bacterium]MCU7521695.1 PAS domain S-box protein [Ignavibacteria bacterium]
MRKNSASGFQKNDKELEMLFQNSFDALLLTGRDGKIYRANSAAEELFGYTAEELCSLGRLGLADMTDPNWPKAIEERDRTGKYIGILRCRRKDGTLFYCEVTSRVFKAHDGSMRASTSVRDVTDRIESEKRLQAANRQLQEIIDGSPTVIFVKDLHGRLIIVNKKLEELFGMTGEALRGKKDSEIFPKEWIEYFGETDETPESGRIMEISEDSDFPGGMRRYFFLNKFPLFDENARPYALCGIASDISKTMETERQFHESRKGLIEAQKLAHMGSFTFDASTGMLDWMDEVFNIFERDPEKGHPNFLDVLNYVHPDDREYVNACLDEAQKYKKTLYMEYRIITDKGNIKYLRYIGNPIFDSDGNLVRRFGTVLDITESKTAELKLKTTLRNLERSNRELEQFAYIASHDLQEPLRMVSNFARLLAQRYQDHLDEKANEFITFMIDGTKRMQNLISDLLQYARLTTKAQPFVATDMNQIMDYVAADLRMAIDEKNAYLNYDRLPEINADPIQMRQLMQNLVANAIKFKGDRDPEICVEACSNENEWVFCVRDNGIGIAPEYHDRIFIIFQRLHEREKYAGTGIGLALCKKIVERHGGRIWLESEEGHGASFYFTIPFGSLQL